MALAVSVGNVDRDRFDLVSFTVSSFLYLSLIVRVWPERRLAHLWVSRGATSRNCVGSGRTLMWAVERRYDGVRLAAFLAADRRPTGRPSVSGTFGHAPPETRRRVSGALPAHGTGPCSLLFPPAYEQSVTDLGSLQESAVAMRLLDAGFSEEAIGELAPTFQEVGEVLPRRVRADGPRWNFFVPGRIEVLGKHTDYAGGSSLTCATERGFCVAVAPSTEPVLQIRDVATGEAIALDLTGERDAPEPEWATYPTTVVRRVRENFDVDLQGGHVAFASTLPQAAGMSSSSALVILSFLALSVLSNLSGHPLYREHLGECESLAEYLGAVESGAAFGPFAAQDGVGTAGGSQDHTAILCSAPGRLREFAYRPTRRHAAVPLPDGSVFVIANSGVVAEKTGAEREQYNRASRLADATARAWREATGRDDPHLGAAVASDAFTPDRMREVLRSADGPFESDALIRRFDHFYREHCEILPAAVDALRDADLEAFGEQVDRSQQAAEELLGNQVPETSFLARSARELGAAAASAFGAGFGGSVWALVPAAEAATFRDEWAGRYAKAFPDAAQEGRFFVERTGPAAFEL